MNIQEKEEILADLAAGREALLDAIRDLPEELAAHPPAPGRWSVLECVEHVAVVEDYLLSQILVASDAAVPTANPEREARIRSIAPTRTRRVPAPEAALPKGRFPTLREAARSFLSSRERTMRYVENCAGDLRARLTTHPILGRVNCYEMLLMLAAHPRRHAQQIDEIKSALQ